MFDSLHEGTDERMISHCGPAPVSLPALMLLIIVGLEAQTTKQALRSAVCTSPISLQIELELVILTCGRDGQALPCHSVSIFHRLIKSSCRQETDSLTSQGSQGTDSTAMHSKASLTSGLFDKACTFSLCRRGILCLPPN